MSRADRPPRLTTTSHAVLGLLAIRSWSAYELTGQFSRSLTRFWPRATSKVYEEPTKLVAHGFATRHDEQTGRRSRSVFTITDAGKAALRSWLATPAQPAVVVEAEPLLRVFLADHGTTADLLRAIDGMRTWAEHRLSDDAAIARSYLDGDGPFPDRLPYLALVGAFSSDVALAVHEWAVRATATVSGWPEEPALIDTDRELLASVAGRSARDEHPARP